MAAIGKTIADQALQQQTDAQARGQRSGPCSRMPLLIVKHPEKCPHAQGDGKREHHIRKQDSREEKEPNAGRHAKTRIEACPSSECPGSKSRSEPAKSNRRECNGNARNPVMHAENFKGDGDHPVDERRLFEVGDAIQARRHPIARSQHIPSDLRLHRVDVVHQRWRGEDAAEINGRGEEDNNQKKLASAYSSTASACRCVCFPDVREGADLIFHRFIHRNRITRPHR